VAVTRRRAGVKKERDPVRSAGALAPTWTKVSL